MAKLDDKKVQSRSNLVNAGSTIILVAMFAIAALVLLAAGMQVYQKVVLASNENFELRTSVSYVAAKIRQCDSVGRVSVENYDGIDMLVLSETIDGDLYNTMIYHKDGRLYELMQSAYLEPDLDFAFETMEIDSFSIKGDQKSVTLTAGNSKGNTESLTLYLRSGE